MKRVFFAVVALTLMGCGQGFNGNGLVVSGPAGPAGQNGLSVVTKSVAATASQCANGGEVLLVSQDNLGTGTWDASDKLQTSFVICNGLNGSVGATGQTGATGASGSNGTNATPVVPVQLCPGTPSYPSTFVESALCIGGQLYAVYSQNGGFWTLLTPGTYSSDGIGSSCNLTVHPNCVVTN